MAGRISYLGGIVTNGLVLDLDAAKRDSYAGTGTAWNDISGNRNNGTLTNVPTFNSANGGSIVFDGVDDLCTFSSSPSNVVTVSIWLNLTTITNAPIILASSTNIYDSGTWNWSMYIFSSTFFIRGNAGPTGQISTPASTLLNTWTNWVLVRNDGNNICRVYRNGVLFGTSNESSSTNNPIKIANIATNYYNGRISQTLIYNRALSATEVLQNYNATRGRFGL